MKREVEIFEDEARTGSFMLAQGLEREHKIVTNLIRKYKTDFEKFSILKVRKSRSTGGRPANDFLLTYDQVIFLLSLIKNSDVTIALKLRVIKLHNVTAALEALKHFDTGDINVKYVYAIISQNGFVKIGITNDIGRRMSELRAANGTELELVMSKRADLPRHQSETMLHNKCSDFRVHNEWFTKEALEVINEG